LLRNNIIEAVILTGPAKGEIAFIPRIPMIPSDLPFSFKRLQFPVQVSFAITINKAQGQTFKYVGVDLRTECFLHEQLYVAFSRTGDPNHLMILISTGNITKNIIYSEVL
jgi:ATP-dependent DNA helicase PIF1